MFWEISFWILVAILILPLPFKVYGYLNGSDKSRAIVKIEEMANAAFLSVGLLAFYGFLNDEQFLTPVFWKAWLIIAILWSFLAMFWSPKLAYATEIMGKSKMRVAAVISLILISPLLFAVYLYAF